MKIFKMKEFIELINPSPGQVYKPEILTHAEGTKNLGGIFGVLPPGSPANYHYHRDRDSILIVLSGEATEIVEGREVPIHAGDVIYIPPGEKHGVANRSDKEFRYLEFFTHPPVRSDFVEVK
jgi:quercetin dioxygenase-like cupin family protein